MVKAVTDLTTVIMHEKALLFSLNIHSDLFVLYGAVELESVSMELPELVKSCLTDTFVRFVIFDTDSCFKTLYKLSEVYCSGL